MSEPEARGPEEHEKTRHWSGAPPAKCSKLALEFPTEGTRYREEHMSRRPKGVRTMSPGRQSLSITRRNALALAAGTLIAGPPGVAAAGPQGQLTWGIHVSMAPTWFDPAETSGLITPFMVLYALQDAMLKPMPGN